MNSVLKDEILDIRKHLTSGIIPQELDILIAKYKSVGIRDNLRSLREMVFCTLADCIAACEVESTIEDIKRMRNDKLSDIEICDVLNISAESLKKLELGWGVITNG